MSRTRWGSAEVGGAVACDQLRESVEVLEARQDGDTIESTTASYRLLRVLVVDDYRDAADSLALLVKMWGHDVRLAYDGAAALEMASAFRPDVLLLDIAMPKMNGVCTAQQLRRQARFQDTRLIAITGYGDSAHRLLWEKVFDIYLVKPVECTTLEVLLMLEQGRLARSPVDVLEGRMGTARTMNQLGGAPVRSPRFPLPATGLLARNGNHWPGRSFAGQT
jgi:CheY-like chemotaxis protein